MARRGREPRKPRATSRRASVSHGPAIDYARAIERHCEEIFEDPAYCVECNWFAWKIAVEFCSAHGFGAAKTDLSADRMIEVMNHSNGWTRITAPGNDAHAVTDTAIRLANEGKLVVAGMTAAELGQDHGHLAIVVRGDGQRSGIAGRKLPLGHAGSRIGKVRIPNHALGRFGLGWSFPASAWQSYGYWYRLPDLLPRPQVSNP